MANRNSKTGKNDKRPLRKRLKFGSIQHLTIWLQQHPIGRELLEQLLPKQKREPVLVVIHSDGWVELYAEKAVDAKIVLRPCATSDPHLLDQFVEDQLAQRHQDLYYPNKLKAFDLCRKITPERLLDSQYELSIIRAIMESCDGKVR